MIYRMFVFFLFFTIINEGLSHYKIYSSYHLNKLVFYNAFFFLQFIIINIILIVSSPPNKYIRAICMIFMIGAAILLLYSGFSVLSPDFITVICIGLIVLPFSYLFLSYSKGNISNLRHDSLLFFSVGLIVTQFLLLLYINAKRIDSFKSDSNSLLIFRLFNTIGNIIYYLLIIYSFICTSIFRRRAGI